MSESLQKFKELLRRLFQFESADLDFGIYRIMSQKRTAIEAFVEKDLPASISAALRADVLGEQAHAVQQLQEVANQVRENFGEDALDGDGNLAPRHQDTRLGRKYLDIQAKARGSSSQDALETTVYNHLFSFFSRYYDAGDFLSRRRYSKSEKYAVPYNGEEVYLHWANKDQYYVKTSEYFTDYRFVAHGLTVHFKLVDAHADPDNVKGAKRFFIPQLKDVTFDDPKKELVVPFVYRALTGQETVKYGQKNQQDAINTETLASLPKRFKENDQVFAALLSERRRNADGDPISQLQHHLLQYTRRNTTDYFVHKDLRTFLDRELDFYLKNEVLLVDEVLDGDAARAEAWFQLSRAILAVGRRIINFVAQIEDFQKTLFEKRKFILETQYCVACGSIAAELHEDIAENDAQWQEWKALFHIDEEQRDLFSAGAKTKTARRIAFLQKHPGLVVDTKHFKPAFVDRLLGSFPDISDITDGILIHGENFQALNLMTPRFSGAVECVYIDPPYNTGPTEILYKNDYKNSSWLSLMENRLAVTRKLLAESGILVVAIDDYELAHLCELLDKVLPERERSVVVVNHHPQGAGGETISRTHEYALFMVPTEAGILKGSEKEEVEYRPFMRSGTGENNFRYGRPNSFFAVLVDPKQWKVMGIEKPPKTGEKYPTTPTKEGWRRVYPLGGDGRERVWRNSYEGALKLVEVQRLMSREGGALYQVIPHEGRRSPVFSNWVGTKYNAGTHGTNLLADIIGSADAFLYPKSLFTVSDAVEAATHNEKEAVVLDYFAGSGTTGHAAIHLNRQDGGRRRFVLVEMGQYFDTVLLPRIKKIMYAPEWKEGKPKRLATKEETARGPRVVKYLTLESYDDALANITFDEAAGQPALQFDDYLINYMLKWETRASNTFLNVEHIADPFSYKLRVVRDGQSIERAVDLPETFASVLGLRTRTRRVLNDAGRRYVVERGTIDHREVAVIWRNTADWSKANFERDRKFVEDQKLTEGADDVFVNADSTIPGAKSLDPLFKARMFAPLSANEAI